MIILMNQICFKDVVKKYDDLKALDNTLDDIISTDDEEVAMDMLDQTLESLVMGM